MKGTELFEKVVELCGLPAMIGPGLVRRSLTDGKAEPETATPSDYRNALPRLVARMKAYAAPDDAERRARRIVTFLAQLDGHHATTSHHGEEDETETTGFGRAVELLRQATPASGIDPLDWTDNTQRRQLTAEELELLRRTRIKT